jgi:regulatory protein
VAAAGSGAGEVTAADLRRAAMDLLARREHSQLELQRKLAKRFEVAPEAIQATIERLTLQGLQSDQRLAEAYLRARSNGGQGPIKIKSELREKGVAEQLVQQAFKSAALDWEQLAVQVLQKRFGSCDFEPLEAPDDDVGNNPAKNKSDWDKRLKMQAKRTRFLQQRGFTFEQIRAAEAAC